MSDAIHRADLERGDAAIAVLKALVADLQAKVQHPEHYTPRAHEQHQQLLRHRLLELANRLDQQHDPEVG